jgi:transposase
VRIAAETDVERLRQMALLLEAENARLHRRLVELTRALAEARGEAQAQLELELQHLQEQLAAQTRALFARSSERRASQDGEPAATPATPRRGHGPRPQAALPLAEVIHTLDAPDQVCPQCGGDLQAWAGQFEEAEEIDVVERSFRLVRHKRQKYRCRCGSCIDTALGPPKLLPGGRYSVDFAVAVAVGKYLDHRVPRMHTRTPQGGKGEQCCERDEGWPLGVEVQALASNRLTLRGSRVRVVSGEETACLERVRCGSGSRTQVNR